MAEAAGRAWSRLAVGLGVPVAVALVCALPLGDLGPGRVLDDLGRDRWFSGVRRDAALGRVAIVGFDRATLERNRGVGELDRREHARLLRTLTAAGAAAVAFDFAFVRPPVDPAQDEELAAACRASGRTVLGALLPDSEDERQAHLQLPTPTLRAAAAAVGLLGHPTDPDSYIRRATLTVAGAEEAFHALGFQAWLTAEGVRSSAVTTAPGGLVVAVGNDRLRIPLDDEGTVLIDYAGPEGTVATFGLYDVLDGKVPPAAFANRVVFVGPTDRVFQDVWATPPAASGGWRSGRTMTGVEIHANTFLTVHGGLAPGGRFLVPAPAWATLACMLVLGLATAACAAWLDVRLAAALTVGLVAAYFWAAQAFLFSGLRWLPSLGRPALTALAVYVAVAGQRFLEERRARLQVRQMFQHYVPAHVVERLENDPSMLNAPGRSRELTVLFCDIREFTPLAERLTPEQTVLMLNRYFEAMGRVILAHDGMIDKFIGDAILAVFGEPYSSGDHAAQGVRAALGMRAALRSLNRDPSFRSLLGSDQPMDNGMAVNTGSMIMGNLGAEQSKSYTVIGDAVNLCSRLEGLAKGANPRIIISQATYERVKGLVEVKSLGEVHVKGKAAPVVAYGVVESGEVSA